MRLLDAQTHAMVCLSDENAVKKGYAILSHTWGGDEVTFPDIQDLAHAKQKAGWSKIEFLCQEALRDGLKYAWIDTCCIDNSSSAELSEAINSMWRWYAESRACYVYLDDVWEQLSRPLFDIAGPGALPQRQQAEDKSGTGAPSSNRPIYPISDAMRVQIGFSRWFSRGWTLQELIAPTSVKFFIAKWIFIGTRRTLSSLLESVTGIPFSNDSLRSVCAARKMSWAAKRQTSRPEDRAYSLLGLFDVHMPLIYGEGERKAFERLQIEILQSTNDLSLLLWKSPIISRVQYHSRKDHVLAASPEDFSNAGSIVQCSVYRQDLRAFPLEIIKAPCIQMRLTLPVIELTTSKGEGPMKAGILNYRQANKGSGPLALQLMIPRTHEDSIGSETVCYFADVLPLVVKPTFLANAKIERLLVTDHAQFEELTRPDQFKKIRIVLDSWCLSNLEFIDLGGTGEDVGWEKVDGAVVSCNSDQRPRNLFFRYCNLFGAIIFKTIVPSNIRPSMLCKIVAINLADLTTIIVREDRWIWLDEFLPAAFSEHIPAIGWCSPLGSSTLHYPHKSDSLIRVDFHQGHGLRFSCVGIADNAADASNRGAMPTMTRTNDPHLLLCADFLCTKATCATLSSNLQSLNGFPARGFGSKEPSDRQSTKRRRLESREGQDWRPPSPPEPNSSTSRTLSNADIE